MKPSRYLSFIAISLLLAGQVTAQENLSLPDAIRKSLENNYNIRIIKQSQTIAETNNSWGTAGRYPTINLGLSSANKADYNENTDYVNTTLNPGINLNWVVFSGFSVSIQKQKLDALTELSEGNTAVVVEQTIQTIILAYYRVLLEAEALKVVREVMDLSKDRYDYTLTKKEIGNAVTYEVLLAKNAWLEDKSAFLLQELNYNNAVRDLNYFMGVNEDITYTFTEKFTAPEFDYQLSDLRAKMLVNNKTLKNQYINEILREKDIALAKSSYYPTLSLRSGVDAITSRTKPEGMDASTSHSHNVYTNLTLNFNIFDGGNKKRAMQVAQIQQDIAETETAEMEHSLTNELAQLYDMYQARKNLFFVAEENTDAARLNLQISGDKFKAGTINSFNYRDVQLMYLNSATNRIRAIFNLIDTNTSLMRITGGIISE